MYDALLCLMFKYMFVHFGACATLIVQDCPTVTDPENPVIPHQRDFRTVNGVTANRVWIRSRKRASKNANLDEPGPSTPPPGFKTSIILGDKHY
ncbi:unnamed protein product [Gongylonema pulchrum]|uniref:Secreted protein n=1 Tax=Gongylonema pulchrum TaxID=637853 RepID=A0A183E7E0_9BILA|nr:unnamed protein product [Gongylonema pulchrum]